MNLDYVFFRESMSLIVFDSSDSCVRASHRVLLSHSQMLLHSASDLRERACLLHVIYALGPSCLVLGAKRVGRHENQSTKLALLMI